MRKNFSALSLFYKGINMGAHHYFQIMFYILVCTILMILAGFSLIGIILTPGLITAQVFFWIYIHQFEKIRLLLI